MNKAIRWFRPHYTTLVKVINYNPQQKLRRSERHFCQTILKSTSLKLTIMSVSKTLIFDCSEPAPRAYSWQEHNYLETDGRTQLSENIYLGTNFREGLFKKAKILKLEESVCFLCSVNLSLHDFRPLDRFS